MKTISVYYLQIIVFLLAASSLFAQNQDTIKNKKANEHPGKMFNTWSVTGHFGMMIFYGDLMDYDWVPKNGKEMKFGYGISVNKTFSPVFGLNGNILSGKLAGSKAVLNNKFEASVFEYTLNANLNLSNLFAPNKLTRRITTFATIGLGLVDFRSLERSISTDVAIGGYGYSNFATGPDKESKTTEAVFPVSIGIKTHLTQKIDLALATSVHYVNSDKLDALVVTASPKDKFGYTSINLTYYIGKKNKSLDWSTPYEVLNADSDKDGVADIIDKEPNTFLGAPVDVNGVTLDSDADGVPDIDDMDPYTERGVKVDARGIAIDGDGDGVSDTKDKELETPKGALVNFQGISISSFASTIGQDDDNDGVPNTTDKEPNTPKGALVNFQGVSIAMSMFVDSLFSASLPSIYFKINSAKVDIESYERIAPVAKMLLINPSLKVEVIGYADKTGSTAYNRELSKRRAEAVLDVLCNIYGISKDRLFINYFGDTKPLTEKAAMLINRRVDFMLMK